MSPRPTLLGQLHELDQRAFDAVATWRSSPALDATLPRISRFANHGVLWLAIAALSFLFGGHRHKRAAVRGLLSVGLASFIANGPTKFTVRRARPAFGLVPEIRALVHPPTTSFPSGHSASAAAFAVGYALEAPKVAIPIAAAASAVAVSRVYVGVHFPGDVIAGAALGAALAVLTTRSWPVVDDSAVDVQSRMVLPHRHQIDPRDGNGMMILVNPKSGPAIGGISVDDIVGAFPDADVRVLTNGTDPVEVLRSGADDAHVLGVSGGDGTVIAAAQVAMETGRPLAVAPGGTFNYFAHSVEAETLRDTVAAVEGGEAVAVDVGTMGDEHIFLNMASIGGHVDFVRDRERLEPSVGKPVAMAIALARVFLRGKPAHLRIDGRDVSAYQVFVGNCAYSPDGFAPTARERLDDGLLDVRIVRADRRLGWTRLVLAALLGKLALVRGSVYEEHHVRKLVVESADGSSLQVALDGELIDAGPRLDFGKRDTALRVLVPPSGDAART